MCRRPTNQIKLVQYLMRIQEHTDLSRVGQHIHLFEKSFLCKFEEAPPEQLNKRGTDQTVNKVLAAQYSDGVCGALLRRLARLRRLRQARSRIASVGITPHWNCCSFLICASMVFGVAAAALRDSVDCAACGFNKICPLCCNK